MLALLALLLTAAEPPLALHPDNPHDLLFRGKPAVLVASGEHYGAVLNLDFDFVPYLNEIQRNGLNLTRTFSGTYREVPGSFHIRDNTLAPRPGRFQSPWVRVSKEGEPERFDLDRFDDAYFQRLRSFLGEAGKRGIIVEFVLFCPLYDDALWAVSPFNARNNVNGVGDCPREEALTRKHPNLVARQEAFTRRVVAELRAFDNLYFEVCNEPYFGGVTGDWQDRIIAAIVDAEKDLEHKHLIARNIANGQAKVEHPNPAVSIFNFHYARPPATVALNYGLNLPIADDETGFQGTADRPYRTEAWDFLLAGGAIVSNLDYSFTPEHEDGTAEVKEPTPGGGGRPLRRSLAAARRFIEGFDFVRMRPVDGVIVGELPRGTTARALAERGKQYGIYVNGGGVSALELDLPAGRFEGAWVDPKTGDELRLVDLQHDGGRAKVEAPKYEEDIALRLVARQP